MLRLSYADWTALHKPSYISIIDDNNSKWCRTYNK